MGVSQPLRLVVNPTIHADELERFESEIVRGPGPEDCAIWTGAIGGDRIMLRGNRYALAAARPGVPLEPWERALHGCDNPVCVRVSTPGEVGLLHLVTGSQRDNMQMMGRSRRGGGRTIVRRGEHGVADRRARAVALREAVRHGWDAEAVAAALLGSPEPTLW